MSGLVQHYDSETSPKPHPHDRGERAHRGGQAPGAARWGNFNNYYRFHDTLSRVQLLPLEWFREQQNLKSAAAAGSPAPKGPSALLALDIGCNSGVSLS